MPDDYGQKVTGTGITRYERVETVDGGDGKWHYIDRQNLSNSCGPACVRMVVQMIKGVRIGEAYFAGLIAVSELGTAPSSVNPLSDTAQSAHDFDAAGTISGHLVTALKDAKVDKARKLPATTADWGAAWKACSVKFPGIISVKWAGSSSAHFIVVAGPVAGSTTGILILDPAYGVQRLELASPTTYTPHHGGSSAGLVLATGQLQKMAAIVSY